MVSILQRLRSLFHPRFPGGCQVGLRIEARAPCPTHAPKGEVCRCMKPFKVVERDALATKQFAQMVRALVLTGTESSTVKDTGGTSRTVSNASATSAVTIRAGTTGTAATVTDFALGTETETQASTTINTYSGSGSSGSFTVTGTITAGADRAYAEVGLSMVNGGNTFLICHDTFSTLNVSNTGTLAVTYTLTFS